MSAIAKPLIVFLLLATLIASAGAQVTFLPASSGPQPAGCHQPASNAPAPVTHNCCQAGHDSLLLLSSDPVRLTAQLPATPEVITLFESGSFLVFSSDSASPPGGSEVLLPLRV